jgi:predicted house-cleaning NTP pyrophosphatase (Maf/HAM1 superfamily)
LWSCREIIAKPCAGGFALEGRGGLLVERIDGCYSNVIGLSLPLLRRWLGFPMLSPFDLQAP